ncbi:MAG: hypothetical protein A2V70_11620 [Planctomycetes bacterium RBG_13_63_9]|nr:MAG: hypothetical protein A2V70_11620 [Planctomycetes bacterium RBG_13_63_9]
MSHGFTTIPLTTLCASTSLPVDLYLKSRKDAPPVLYRQRQYPISHEDIERLVETGIRVAHVPTQQLPEYQLYLRENLDSFMVKEEIPPTQRYQFLSETARDLLHESFERGNTEVLIQTTSTLGDSMVDMVANHSLLTSELFSILRHDYETFTHSFNTASFCLLLAKGMGITNLDELKEVATGAMLHDVGKLHISNAILNKTTPLTDMERRVIPQHPRDGFIMLCQREGFSRGQLMMVYQHHERLDGSGYPVGQSGGGIHCLARFCAVVDVFDAMTSHRPYRRAVSVPKVLDYLDSQSRGALDKEIVRCWNTMIATCRERR